MVPFERTESFIDPNEEMVLGRLAEFCPEASVALPSTGDEPKRIKKSSINYNILSEPTIPMPQLDTILK